MGGSRLKGRQMLAIDDEPDVLDILEEELRDLGVELDQASSHDEGLRKISSNTYDLVILDIMGVNGFELLKQAVAAQLPVVVLTAHALSPYTLKTSIELGARAYVPKDRLGQIGPFLEEVLTLDYRRAWTSLLEKLSGSFSKRFGPEWRQSEREFWEAFEQQTRSERSVVNRS
jgi:CheY-like chemotaxis protein